MIVMIAVIVKKLTAAMIAGVKRQITTIIKPPKKNNLPPSKWVLLQLSALSNVQGSRKPAK